MRTILKKGFILMISLFIAGNLITVAQNNVRAYKMDAGKTYYSGWSYIKMIK